MVNAKKIVKDHQRIARTEGSRAWMLIEIKRMMGGGTEAYYSWFDRVYKHRAAGDQTRYEAIIRRKYFYLRSKERKANALPPLPDTTGMTDSQMSATLGAWFNKNWDCIPEMSL